MTEEKNVAAGDDLKQKLVKRVALGGVLIVALLGGLAVFDALLKPDVPAPPPKAAAPTPSSAAAPRPGPTLPEPEAAQQASTEPPPSQQQAANEQAKTAGAPDAQTKRPDAVVKADVRAEPEDTAAPVQPAPRAEKPVEAKPHASKQPSGGRLLLSPPPESPAPHASAVPGRGYLLQVGVFKDVSNAEELKGRLVRAGVPAQLEARVQVGPFKTRSEADQARAKLKEMGLSGGILVVNRGK